MRGTNPHKLTSLHWRATHARTLFSTSYTTIDLQRTITRYGLSPQTSHTRMRDPGKSTCSHWEKRAMAKLLASPLRWSSFNVIWHVIPTCDPTSTMHQQLAMGSDSFAVCEAWDTDGLPCLGDLKELPNHICIIKVSCGFDTPERHDQFWRWIPKLICCSLGLHWVHRTDIHDPISWAIDAQNK